MELRLIGRKVADAPQSQAFRFCGLFFIRHLFSSALSDPINHLELAAMMTFAY